jgi:hypothetical protein
MRLIERVPAGIRTQPTDAMLVLLGIPAGLSTLVGASESRALDTLLPWLAVKGWAVALLVGCAAWVVGLSGVRLHGDVVVLTRLAAYRFGLHLLAVASLVYGVAILMVVGTGGVLAAWPLLAFAAATWLKAVDLGRIQRRSRDNR